MKSNRPARWLAWTLCGCLFGGSIASTGCQSSVGGQSLPSPWYHTDDVQYYAPAQEHKLAKEAAALKAYKADQQARQQQP